MAILKNSLIVSVWTSVSRGLGFARDLLIANKLGAGLASDAFFVALMLPNLLRRLFAEGAFNVAFIPILARHKAASEAEALHFASVVLSWLTVIVSAVVVVGILCMPQLMLILAGGWADQPEKFNYAVELARITFPYLGLITIASFLGALCNTWGKFAAYAMVPALLNLSIIGALFVLPWGGAHPAEAAAWAVPLGGVLQVAYMAWSARRLGLRLTFGWLPQHEDLHKLLLRLGPALLGVGVLQLAVIVDTVVASYLPDGAVSYLQNANRFYQAPLALIGIAVATVLLPHLAVLLGKGAKADATQSFTAALSACLAIACGSMVLFFCLAAPLMDVLLRHGAMTPFAAQMIAYAMMGYVAGLPGYILTKITAPAFFAAEDPLSPVKASAAGLGVNLALNIIFVLVAFRLGLEAYAHIGIAVATAVGGYVNAGLQWYWLSRKGVLALNTRHLLRELRTMALLVLATGAVLVLWQWLLPYQREALWLYRAAWLVAAGALGGAVFLVGLEYSGLLKLRSFLKALRQRKRVKLAGADSATAD
ncbi:MAG: murein biosynthesis integral membrane protein MurJ [Alphaproteobacteria bacterium]|nr:murein biosynthesis integral membrane protein MurJ [Alphaproteobacteria bacterium]